ncbi:DNA processing protein [Litorivivens lipolytica]|uniref:DNA processing protein n=1 Tax=Litorivivens lipolytica TaxID=1524264 RepID=A0A7W4W843_9GAMM|nr:DNA-processing protein DprA [Litorivivens lipolytica]MBB3048629.1 DNA processing protein [Litorivivens lipolytica]
MDVASLSSLQWLLISQWPGLSRSALLRLMQQAPNPTDLLMLSDSACLEAGARQSWLAARSSYLSGRDHAAEFRADAQLQALASMGARILPYMDEGYPALLREIPDPPPLLYVAGRTELLAQPQLAVVGSRNASRGGLALAESFASDLAGRGLCITSGLAWGVDSSSHQGALKAGGDTIAVLGTGIDVPYPRRNLRLYHDILERGLLVSEFPPGSPPRREQFPQRNRVISGLSLGVLVVEAAPRSGSLITARFALEQGREVFAIPGSIHNPLARGCHRLIREGAALVESAADILEAWVGWLPPALAELESSNAKPPTLEPGQQHLLNALGFDPLPLDRLSDQCRVAVDELLPELLALELEGWVEQQGACWVRCK